LGYYGVPEQAVQCFIDTCPMVSNTLFYFITVISVVLLISSPFFCQCLSNIILTKAKQHPLKMILLQRVGSRFQMDLIEMPPCDTYRHILHVVHHFSLYGFVAPLKQILASEIGEQLIKILSFSIMPEVLQSDNGGEVRD
jgi:hypothetical protein